MGERLYAIVVVFHLTVAMLHHVGSAAMVCRIMEGMLPTLHRMKAFAPIRYYAHYTGTGIGSGYFAPRVGSSFHVEAWVIDHGGRRQRAGGFPWATRAAQLRYTAFCQLFQGFLTGVDSTDAAYERAVAHHIARRMAHPLVSPQTKAVVTRVSVYRPPTLARYGRGDSSATLLEVFRDTTVFTPLAAVP